MGDLQPYRVHVADEALEDLQHRLASTRWPEPAPTPGWQHGIPLEVVQQLCDHWQHQYDWRRPEARINRYPQHLFEFEGLRIHLVHVRSAQPDALPLVLTHGWPGSPLELLDLVGPLTDPIRFGGRAADAFHLVMPSLPGYGFSDKPSTPGWGLHRIARAWSALMAELGYTRYGAAGSDWGTSVSSTLALQDPDHVAGIHLVPPLAGPGPDSGPPFTPAETALRSALEERGRTASAYVDVHRTAPQTIGYALDDSPVGLLAWMGEKLLTWTDPRPVHAGAALPGRGGLTHDQVLDEVALYWLTRTAASSARLYAESIEQVNRWIDGTDAEPVPVPVGASIFPAEVPTTTRRWAARRYPDIRYWAEHSHGGHFPALETPDVVIDDLRRFFGPLR